MEMTPERWSRTVDYVRRHFAGEDHHLKTLMSRAIEAGLPDIDVGPESGLFLQLLVRLTSARTAIEVGTLAGYSAIWIARGLADQGRLISIDANEKHLEVARREVGEANLGDRVEFRLGKGGETLRKILDELGPNSVDFILLDAERSEYIDLIPTVRSLLRVGGAVAIDNALNAGRWVSDPIPAGEKPDQMDGVNRAFAAAAGFVCTLLPVGNGILVGARVID